MDGIHDMGGTQGWGEIDFDPDEPAFTAPWQGRAFAMCLLSMNRLTGRNLDAMRHALERLRPLQYLTNGYYGRWLAAKEERRQSPRAPAFAPAGQSTQMVVGATPSTDAAKTTTADALTTSSRTASGMNGTSR